MAAGQGPLTGNVEVSALAAAEALVDQASRARAVAHGLRLRGALEVHLTFAVGGNALAASAHLAMLEQTSELSAGLLIDQARLLASLDGGLEAVDTGVLSMELAVVLTRVLRELDPALQAAVWADALAALLLDQLTGTVTPPAEFGRSLRRWVVQRDPKGAAARRQTAEQDADVSYRGRDDGLYDLFGYGFNAPTMQAMLSRIRDLATPFGSEDPRSAGKRRADSLADLVLGRAQLPLDDEGPVRHCGPSCGCWAGEPAPCGASITVLVPIGAALGTTDEVAELQGHGPIEPDLLHHLLHNGAVLHTAYVDDQGLPVSLGAAVETPPVRDPQAVRDALLRIAASSPPGPLVPRHPDDHDPSGGGLARDDGPPPGPRPPVPPPSPSPSPSPATSPPPPRSGARRPTDAAAPVAVVLSRAGRTGSDDAWSSLRGALTPGLVASALRPRVRLEPSPHSHPPRTPGRYRPPARMARLVRIRAPRCEWPGCGAASVNCDLDHDVPHPDGPTCGCNLGPCCRRHHRLKHLYMTKLRVAGAVLWTSPTGRTWRRPDQHRPPQPSVRPLPALWDPYGPEVDDLDQTDDGIDPRHSPDPMTVSDEPDHDPFDGVDLVHGWGMALDDPTRWHG